MGGDDGRESGFIWEASLKGDERRRNVRHGEASGVAEFATASYQPAAHSSGFIQKPDGMFIEVGDDNLLSLWAHVRRNVG